MPENGDLTATFARRRAESLQRYMDDAGFDYEDVLEALVVVSLRDAHLAEAEEQDSSTAAFCRRAAQAIDLAHTTVVELREAS